MQPKHGNGIIILGGCAAIEHPYNTVCEGSHRDLVKELRVRCGLAQ